MVMGVNDRQAPKIYIVINAFCCQSQNYRFFSLTKNVVLILCILSAVHTAPLQLRFLLQQICSVGYQCKCSHDAIATIILISIQPIKCNKQNAVAVAPREQSFDWFS